MNRLKRLALAARCRLTAAHRRRQIQHMNACNEAPMMVLFYHRVADTTPNDWTISCAQFERHVDYCRSHFDLIGLDELQRRVREFDSHRPSVTFTFDDGYAENCRFALPLLIRHQVPTVYFVTTGNIANNAPFGHDIKSRHPLPVNTPEELRAMADGGVEIGLHTRNHVDFSRVRDRRVVDQEIVEAKDELEQMIGRAVRYFAVPYGLPEHLTAEVIAATRQAGLDGFCSAYGGYNLIGRDEFHIRRIHGDPEFDRLRNWLSFDRRKVRKEPVIDLGPAGVDGDRSASIRSTKLGIERMVEISS